MTLVQLAWHELFEKKHVSRSYELKAAAAVEAPAATRFATATVVGRRGMLAMLAPSSSKSLCCRGTLLEMVEGLAVGLEVPWLP